MNVLSFGHFGYIILRRSIALHSCGFRRFEMALISYPSVTSWPEIEEKLFVWISLTLSVAFFVILYVTLIVTHLLNFSFNIMGETINSSVQTQKMMIMIMIMIIVIVIIIIMNKYKANDQLNRLLSPILFFEWSCVVARWMWSLTTWRCNRIKLFHKQAETRFNHWRCWQPESAFERIREICQGEDYRDYCDWHFLPWIFSAYCATYNWQKTFTGHFYCKNQRELWTARNRQSASKCY